LVVTVEDTCLIEVKNEYRCFQTDLETYQEEADVIIVQQVLNSIEEARQVTVISDDTDVFVLLTCTSLPCGWPRLAIKDGVTQHGQGDT
jgi:hypothetical protein